MCGIAGAIDLSGQPIADLGRRLEVMNDVQAHRGPDSHAIWRHDRGHVGFASRRLKIIDLSTGDQPIGDGAGSWITYNGEIYNYVELRAELGRDQFRTTSDTEVALCAYQRWGTDCVNHFRGMFAFSIWDERTQTLFCARDRFGIKPFYYAQVGGVFYFASEIKTLIPFLPAVETDVEGLKDYLCFQFCLGGKTMFKGVKELLPGHLLTVRGGKVEISRYWEVYYQADFHHTPAYFETAIQDLMAESVALHLRSDVPVGAYLSGGLDSSIVASLAVEHEGPEFLAFTGHFGQDPKFDESGYAREMAKWKGFEVMEVDIGADDFVNSIEKVIYHLDYPVAGPGSFPQYLVSALAAKHRKVVLGGQGGDEIFGGYTRYLIAYFEQCIKGAIDGSMRSGKFVVTYESIIPNLVALKNYKPLLQEFWREGLFEDVDRRYFRLINRAPSLGDEINWAALGQYDPWDAFQAIFHGKNVGHESYFDSMTHFDFKTLLPALLHVEDRVSMAHGLESRVPFLDHRIVELAATIPADIKFENGNMKHVLRTAMRSKLPARIFDRQDKMGFPVPLHEWFTSSGPVRDYVRDIFSSQAARSREHIDNSRVLKKLDGESAFGRQGWGLLSLELWQRSFHDKAHEFRSRLTAPSPVHGVT